MPAKRGRSRRKAGTPHKPAQRVRRASRRRDEFIGFQPPGVPHEGRRLGKPGWAVEAQGGGTEYSEDSDYAEGEAPEFRG